MSERSKSEENLLREVASLRLKVAALEKSQWKFLKAEKALKVSQGRLKSVTENVNVGIYRNTAGPKGRFIEANPAIVKMFGYKSRSEFLKISVSDLYLHPHDRRRFSQRLKQVGFVRDEVLQLKKKNGIPFYGSISAVAVKDETGKTTHFDGIIEDITDRMRAEEALKENEERYRSLFHKSNDAVFIHDLDGKIIDVNQKVLDLFGYKKSQIKALKILQLHPRGAWKRSRAAFVEVKQKGFVNFECEFFKKNEEIFPAEISSSLIEINGRSVVQGIVRDITDRKKAEEALRRSEEKYRTIFESFYDVYYRTNAEGIVTMISPSVTKHAGYDPEEIIGQHVKEFFLLPDQRNVLNAKIQETGEVNDEEIKLRAKDGRIIDISLSGKLMQDRKGHPVGIEGVMRDITDRKHAEERLKASLKEKEVLLQEIHHRVKNNMQIISSLLNLQSRRLQDPETRRMFQESRDRIRAMALIHEKLYQSQNLAEIDFTQYIRSLALHLYHIYRVDSQAIRFQENLEDVRLDINQAIPCGLIVNELLSNALKHAFPNGSEGEIEISLRKQAQGHYLLKVRDNGIGFPDTSDIRNPHSLGMQLVNDLVEQIDGSISIDRNEGTSIQIEF